MNNDTFLSNTFSRCTSTVKVSFTYRPCVAHACLVSLCSQHTQEGNYRSVDDLTSVILEALTRTHTEARIMWQPAAFFTRCILHKTQMKKWLKIQRQNMNALYKPSPPPLALVSRQVNEWRTTCGVIRVLIRSFMQVL
jgi:hypothetical protein